MSEQIESKDFTFVQAFYAVGTDDPGWCRRYLVMAGKGVTKDRAADASVSLFGVRPDKVHLYPRTYVKAARALYAAGKFR